MRTLLAVAAFPLFAIGFMLGGASPLFTSRRRRTNTAEDSKRESEILNKFSEAFEKLMDLQTA